MDESFGVAHKVFSILELLAQSHKTLGPTEIAQQLGLNKTTVYRLLQVMTIRGYAAKTMRGNYGVGLKLIELASCHINTLELQSEAKPYISMLYAELNLTVHLGTLNGADVVYMEKMDPYPTGASFAHVGYRTPAFCSSMGKCLLAALSGDELDELLYNSPLRIYTSNTIVDVQEFKAMLRTVRLQGWAMDDEEYMSGSRCVGVPLFDYRGAVIASISVSGDSTSLSDDRIPSVVTALRRTATMISEKMGYRP